MKKNTFKKLMSAIVSMAMLVSMMVVPANAVVPGEDAYSGESTIERYHMDTGRTEQLDISNTNMYPDSSTYSFLNDTELTRVVNGADTQEIVPPDETGQVFPTTDPYSGVVLIVQIVDEDNDGVPDDPKIGTGFMISQKVMVTAFHCIHSLDSNVNVFETRVYQGVSAKNTYDGVDAYTIFESLAGYTYDRIDYFDYDTRYVSGEWAGKFEYDWCVATLKTGFDCYYFDCSVMTDAMMIKPFTIVGYPATRLVYMYKATGTLDGYYTTGLTVKHYIDTLGGQSGGPMYFEGIQTRTCYGIYVGSYSNKYTGEFSYNCARLITNDMFNTAVAAINNSHGD